MAGSVCLCTKRRGVRLFDSAGNASRINISSAAVDHSVVAGWAAFGAQQGENDLATDEIQRKLQAGIQAARSGDRSRARRLLGEVIAADRNNESALMWLASVTTSVNERRSYLDRALRINPNNARARQALQQLGGTPPPTRAQARRAAASGGEASEGGGGIRPVNLLLGLVVAGAIVAALVLLSDAGGGDGDATPTPFVQLGGPIITPAPQVQPTVRRVIVTFSGTTGPTLPPTFTATATSTPTATPTPTDTPFPLANFTLLYTGLNPGGAQPNLYQAAGDGSGESQLGDGFRDVAIDPAGLRIAFVRDVEYPADEEAETEAITAPELFVADLNNLGAAQQLTTLGQQGATVVASPTWSPEGTEIIFVSNLNSEDTELVYIRADGEGLRVLTDNDSIDRDPAWQPVFGSRALAITSDQDSPGLTEIYLFELGDSLDNVTYTRLTDASNSSYDPSWSADATQIAFISNRRGDADVYVMNADGSGATLVTVDDGDAEDRSPSFTPDGRLVLFLSNREADRFQIYAASADRRVFLRLTDSNRNEQSAVYLPENDLR